MFWRTAVVGSPLASGSAEKKRNVSPMKTDKTCITCGEKLVSTGGARLCPRCNSEDLHLSQVFVETTDSDPNVFIECPGATLYEPETNKIIAGAEFIDDNDPSKGFRIVDHPVYAPTHTRRRRIRREALGKIRRCQGCQDLTVRMRRREGPDFFIPSAKHPDRKKLRPASFRTYT